MEYAVESAAESAVKTLLAKLGSLLAQEIVLLRSVRDEILSIRDELASMDAFLRNMSKMEDHDDQVKIWMMQVREMAYDAEDCIDEFIHRINMPYQGFSLLKRCNHLLKTLKARHRIAVQIKELKTRARDVADRHSRYVKASTSGSITSVTNTNNLLIDPRLPVILVETQIVDLEGRKDKIISWLVDESVRQLRVISIVGFGGLGKTSLAMMAYQSPNIQSNYFPCRAFITVTRTFDLRLLMLDIIKQFNFQQQGSENWDINTATVKLNERLKYTRYIVVLDDVWTTSAWESFNLILPDNQNCSRIIVTTRMESIANICCFHGYDRLYKMESLTISESRDLFFKKVFDSVDGCPGDLQQVSNDMLKRCGGMPLAIISIAGLLVSKSYTTKEQWKLVYESLSSELEINPTLEGLRKILNLSYNDLPYHLKTCCLYLSIFPEDTKIRRKNLVKRWIAEGFVSEKRGLSVEEAAESYISELVSRSIIQPLDIGFDGKITTCQIHDMMLELIVSKATEENFVSLVGDQYKGLPHDTVRRLSIQNSNPHYDTKSISLSHVRSLTIFGYVGEIVASPRLRLLRVLDLEGCRDLEDHHLKNIGRLFQLKYLSLKNTYIKNLPKQIKKLQHLETLDVRKTRVKVLPPGIINLQHLTHLRGGCKWDNDPKDYMSDSFTRMSTPMGIGTLQSLQILSHIDLSDKASIVGELCHLTQLRKLGIISGIQKEESLYNLRDVLSELSSCLRSLSICNTLFEDSLEYLDNIRNRPILLQTLELSGYVGKLPNWVSELNNLTKLTLYSTQLGFEDAMEGLQNLPNLLCLRLRARSQNAELFIAKEGFPRLKLLLIYSNWIASVRFEKGVMPELEKVELSFGILEDLSGIEHLQGLKEVIIKGFQNGVVQRIVEGLQEMAKNKHPKHPRITAEWWE